MFMRIGVCVTNRGALLLPLIESCRSVYPLIYEQVPGKS